MKISGALIALALATLPPAFAADAPAPDESRTLLHLTQDAQRLVKRDRLQIQLQIQATGIDARTVQAEVNRRMGAALTKAKSVPGIEVETGDYDTYRFTPTTPDGKAKGPEQWRTDQSLILTGKAFDPLLGVAGDLQAEGLVLSGMHFEVAAETVRAARDSLTDEALAALRQRADRVAAAIGMRFAYYRDLQVGDADGQRTGPPRPLMAARMTPSAAPPVAEAGESTISLSVTAEIALTRAP
jgi:uncharacterized protein